MSHPRSRTLGITVLADFILSEGVEAVVANLVKVGATAVATNPTVTAPAPENTGTFQPPADAGSSPRTFDRPLFGKHALWVRSAPSYVPNTNFYRDSPYSARQPKDLTEQHGAMMDEFITACQDAGLQVVFQVGAVQPSGLRDEDRPRQWDGSIGSLRMADTGSLASKAIRKYNEAYVRDLLARYPAIDGFRIDWPEYPCYTLFEALHDFGPHVRAWCEQRHFDVAGLDFDAIVAGMGRLVETLNGGLSDAILQRTRGQAIPAALAALAGDQAAAVRAWLQLKSALSTDLVADWRRILDDHGDGLQLTAHAFMPPYSAITGLDFSRVTGHCDSVSPKFYTMHWPLMVQFWSDWLLERNPDLCREQTIATVASWMELGTAAEIDARLEWYRYPEPDESHPIPARAQQQKLQQVRSQLGTSAASFVPLVHGYGPLHDFAERFRIIWEADVDGVWLNRYGYLSDEKLQVIAGRERS